MNTPTADALLLHTQDREHLECRLMASAETLSLALEFLTMDGGKQELPQSVVIAPYNRDNGYSGYQYRLGEECRAEIGFAPLRWGGFVIHKLFVDRDHRKESWEIYASDGALKSVDQALYLDLLYVDLTEMDSRCPIVSHLYNYLSYEYDQAVSGLAQSRQIALIETFLRTLTVPAAHDDSAIRAVWQRAIDVEMDPVLKWEERQKVLEAVFADRARILRVKKRVHGNTGLLSALLIRLGDYNNRFQRLMLRPSSNLRGFSYKYTIGVLIWFLVTVRSNIGYSMALAIYGPFTFYFITQPLNPHAMWAVGRVRAGYLEVTEAANHLVAPVAAISSETTPSEPHKDAVAAAPALAATQDTSKHLGLPLSVDFPEVDSQNWSDRMSNFKNMQIGYESNMQFAARMGRLEQMETQLDFSMIVDSAWEETERYLDQIELLKANLKTATPALQRFFDEEIVRTRKVEMYIWDRLLRYTLDHPYTVLDQSKEQVYRDYYMGRSILLLRDITNKLQSREKGFQKPGDYKRLEAVAAAFEKTREEGATVLERLRKNSRLFRQKDRQDGNELRGFMKRQWEILYLLQNKAQEASNFGLQLYTWSVRNNIWLLQSLYSAKRRELNLIFESHGRPKEQTAREIRAQIEPLYEQLFHMMNLEFASIKPELSQRLPNDIEFRQRQVIIDTVEAFLKDRDRVLQGLIQ